MSCWAPSERATWQHAHGYPELMGVVVSRHRAGERRGRTILVPAAALATGLVLLVGCTSTTADDDDARPRNASTSTGAPAGEDSAGPASTSVRHGDDDLPEGRDLTVTSITDGDTFRAGDERVRLIGVDTPEVSGGGECYGREATAALDRLIPPGTGVRLVADVEPVDRYGRTLSYVYRSDDGAFVNLALARDGFAHPLTIAPNVAHERDFVEAAAAARRAGRGLWSACADDADPLPTTPPPPADTVTRFAVSPWER